MLRWFRLRHILFSTALLGILLSAPMVAMGGNRVMPAARPIPEPTRQPLQPDMAVDVTLQADVANGGIYRVGSWIPVRIIAQNDGPDLQVEARVNVRSSATFAVPIDLPNGARKEVTAHVYVPGFARRMVVSLVQRGGDASELAQQQLTLDPQSNDRYLVAVISGTGMGLQLPETVAHDRRVLSLPLDLDSIPDRASGLSSFDTLILDDVPTQELSDQQRTALSEWVLRGGHILISGGVGAQRTIAGLPTDLQPVRVLGTEQVTADQLLGGTGNDDDLALTFADPIDATSEIFYTSTFAGPASPDDQPLFIQRSCGNGSVTFSALPLAAPAVVRWEGQQELWNDLLHTRAQAPAGFGPSDMSLDMLLEGNVATTLTQLPALALPSLVTLGLLLVAYIVLVGPVTYIVLRIFDRQALGWVVVPVITVIFALVAYGIGYTKRGGDVVINQVTLVEPFDTEQSDSSLARVRSFIGVFSPAQRSYTLEAAQADLLRPLSLQGPWGPADPQQDGLFVQPAETDPASGARVTDWKIGQWSMRATLADQVGAYPYINAQVTLDGEALIGEVTNNTGQPLHDVVLVQGSRVARLGDMLPGDQQQAEFVSPKETFGMPEATIPLSRLIYGEQIDNVSHTSVRGGWPWSSSFNMGVLPPELQLRANLLDALYSHGPIIRSGEPVLFAWVDETPLEVNVTDQRVERQQTTLVTFAPSLQVTDKRITLDRGWLTRQFETPPESVCMGSHGIGFMALKESLTGSLMVPHDLMGFQPDEMELLPLADGQWPQDVNIALFDWNNHTWVTFDVEHARPFSIDEPSRFLTNGEIRLRFSTEQPFAQLPGCVTVDATLAGTMP